MSILGAIVGDIAGSRFEWHNLKSKEFELFTEACRPTDDSIMTLAIAKAILLWDHKELRDLSALAARSMREWGRQYPNAGYGGSFIRWLHARHCEPYNSWGNGAAMRVSPCAYAADTLEEALAIARAVTEVTHNHPEGIKGAQATTAAVFLSLHGKSKEDIRKHIQENYYPLAFTLDEIRDEYEFDVSCQGSVPQAIEAFLESASFEDAIRNAISVGGDSDTIAAIAGGIAGAYYGIPSQIRRCVIPFLDETQRDILYRFESPGGIGWAD